MTLRLLLIRHGLSSYNRENRIQGRNDLSTLTPEGISQASKIGESLQGLAIHAIYSSPLKRASDTASELLRIHSKSKNIIIDNDLLEVDLAPWSGLTPDEIKNKFLSKQNNIKLTINEHIKNKIIINGVFLFISSNG